VKRQLFLTAALGALLLTACENKNTETASRVEEPYVPLDQMETAPAGQPMTTTGAETPAPDQSATAADEALAPTGQTGGQTHVVQKGDTLFGLARKFYGDEARWKDIWEANRARLSDPDKLSVGMKLIIP
jgi:nucleoid-associated protein YgaU